MQRLEPPIDRLRVVVEVGEDRCGRLHGSAIAGAREADRGFQDVAGRRQPTRGMLDDRGRVVGRAIVDDDGLEREPDALSRDRG
jgi:hypothetical protein